MHSNLIVIPWYSLNTFQRYVNKIPSVPYSHISKYMVLLQYYNFFLCIHKVIKEQWMFLQVPQHEEKEQFLGFCQELLVVKTLIVLMPKDVVKLVRKQGLWDHSCIPEEDKEKNSQWRLLHEGSALWAGGSVHCMIIVWKHHLSSHWPGSDTCWCCRFLEGN